MSIQLEDLELLTAVRDFTFLHPHPMIEKFKPGMRNWGDDWREIEPRQLPAAEFVEPSLKNARALTRPLLQTFAEHRHRLHWEQTYGPEDKLVPRAMLDGYGFADVIGVRGPFVSDRIRSGILVFGPGIDYPLHHHAAEEAYVLLAGNAEFALHGESPARRRAGEVVYVEPNRPHALRTRKKALVIFYLWQGGELRQKSEFD